MKKYSTITIQQKFRSLFHSEPIIVRSPGRINIIGEHTDYNEGYVLPAAIDKAAYIAVGKRSDEELHLYSHSFSEYFNIALKDIAPHSGWPTYVLGVVQQLKAKGFPIGGFNLVIDSDIPLGAGLSSSAALECGVLFSLCELFGISIPKKEMAKMAQAAEHQFAGVRCGIMDQFASLFGKKDFAIPLNCKTLEYEYIPINLEGVKIVLFNTNVTHSLSSSEYNTRRLQCEQGVRWIKEFYPGINALADVSVQMLEDHVLPKDELIYRRCKYVVEEIKRLHRACTCLKGNNLYALGELLFQTHDGLSKEYEVSCKELDFLVDYVKTNPSVLGARMMGGGFGGCTINLVKEEAVEELIEKIKRSYKEVTGLYMDAYITGIENSTELVKEQDCSIVS